MRYVLMNWVDAVDAAAWQAMSPDERQADVERHATVQLHPVYERG